jgi:hypothetical protein
MFNRPYVAATLLAALTLLPAAPAFAAGEILITHAKALAGNVTPGDTAGYPVTISKAGTFQLASTLSVPANKIGIQVTSGFVTIDLNGFLMFGANVAWYGITGGVDGVTVKNGTLANFKFDGIIGSGFFWSIQNVRSVRNGRDGVTCSWSCHVEASISSLNGRFGLNFTGTGIALGNIIYDNKSFGITSFGFTGYGNNSVLENNNRSQAGTDQTNSANQLDPNLCGISACPP